MQWLRTIKTFKARDSHRRWKTLPNSGEKGKQLLRDINFHFRIFLRTNSGCRMLRNENVLEWFRGGRERTATCARASRNRRKNLVKLDKSRRQFSSLASTQNDEMNVICQKRPGRGMPLHKSDLLCGCNCTFFMVHSVGCGRSKL